MAVFVAWRAAIVESAGQDVQGQSGLRPLLISEFSLFRQNTLYVTKNCALSHSTWARIDGWLSPPGLNFTEN